MLRPKSLNRIRSSFNTQKYFFCTRINKQNYYILSNCLITTKYKHSLLLPQPISLHSKYPFSGDIEEKEGKQEQETMSAAITDYFKPKRANKKRKHDEDEGGEIDPIEPSEKSTKEDGEQMVIEPSKKRKKTVKLSKDETKDESEEEEDDEDLEQEEEEQEAPKEITYANFDELIEKSWRKMLKKEFGKVYFKQLRRKLVAENEAGKEIFPPLKMTFRAFELTPWDNLKCVIVGQDPYHDDNQAEGLCFSVQKGIKIPSSLRNMMKEATSDFGFVNPGHGSLIQWGEQGVLLLNTVLTVEAHKANSHKKFGWQEFTDAVIKCISDKHDGVVFILWGGQAKKKKKIINMNKHKIVESAHPSGLSASRGFYGSKPYSKTNAFLKELGKTEINWQIDPSK